MIPKLFALAAPALLAGALGCAATPVDAAQMPFDLLGTWDPQGCAETALRRPTEPALLADSVELMLRGCSLGESDSCSIAGVMHERGRGVRQSRGQARSLYRRACEGGNVRGCGNLGELLLADGATAEAQGLLTRACDAGKGRACLVLGRAHLSGTLQPGPAGIARGLFERGCNAGEAGSCIALADLLERSAASGDTARATEVLEKACAGGDEEGCARLAPRRLGLRRVP